MQSLTATQLERWIAGPEAPPLLLDVREPWEVALARVPQGRAARLDVPMMQIPQRLAEIDRARSVVCICHHGVRSAQVVAFLLQQGWTSVYNLTGGVDAWSLEVDAKVPRY